MRTVSARAARDNDDFESAEEAWSMYVTSRVGHRESIRQVPVQHNLSSSAVFGVLLVGALIAGSLGMPSGAVNKSTSSSFVQLDDFKKFIRNNAAVKLTDNFESGMASWRGTGPSDWAKVNGFIRPGRLRLWSDTLSLTDYQVEIVGQIERRSLGWAYRASDLNNYYASKITLSRPGPLPKADLVRYAMIRGKVEQRTVVPLYLDVRSDTVYRINLAVRGDQFTTTVNGKVVDTWNDRRLSKGGVGFFSERGEVASIRRVSVSVHDNAIGHIFSYFGFWMPAYPVLEPLGYSFAGFQAE